MSVRISYSKGRTINIGNYESLRVDIGIELDVPTQQEADAVFPRLKQWVDARLEKETTRG